MSQNFSKMSDIYIPELMELDSYWQKAVEDAICDTLKGEKRLFYALRNRKKIKQKLEMLGLKTTNTQMCISAVSNNRIGSPVDKETSESSSERSLSSQEDGPRGADPGSRRSWSRTRGETSTEKRPKTPDRPLLGNGSLEKLKKSQNSFNCEPMGYDNTNAELTDSENQDELDNEMPAEDGQTGRNKKVQWLHMRKNSDFEFSDSESVSNLREGETEKSDFQKSTSVKDKNYFISKKLGFRLAQVSRDKRQAERQERRMTSRSDSQWETESEDTIPGNPDLERRLHLALAKREILNENLNAMSIGSNRIEIKVHGSAAKLAEKRRKAKTLLSPFVKFYLEVYRELCHKCTVREIGEESGKRWWNMTPKQKSAYADFMSSN